jgi:glycosidase
MFGMKLKLTKYFLLLIVCFALPLHSQDSVAVTFYYKPMSAVNVVYLPGSFNGWGNNANGVITNPIFAMDYDASSGTWFKTLNLLPGTYYYKFNENGSSSRWITDPNNPRVNTSDNNNSTIVVSNPMAFYASIEEPDSENDPYYLNCFFFSSINNPILPDSIYILFEQHKMENLSSFFDTDKKLLRYPIRPEKGTYKVKFFATSLNGVTAQDSITVTITNAPAVRNPVPVDFYFDSKSSFNSIKTVTAVNVPGVFNGWSTSSDPMAFDSENDIWKVRRNFLPGNYEYRFYLNRSNWVDDPDNPITTTTSGNSVITVTPIEIPTFTDFSIPSGKIYNSSVTEFSLSTILIKNSYDIGIDVSTIKVSYNGSLITHNFDAGSSRVTVNISNNMLSEGLHHLYFECNDLSGVKGDANYVYAVLSNEGFSSIDNVNDEIKAYPEYVPVGSADISFFNVKLNDTKDSLQFTVKMQKISDFTRLGFMVSSQLHNTYGSYITNLNIHTPNWSNEGFFSIVTNPESRYFNSSEHNLFYLSSNNNSKGKHFNVNVTPNEEFIFSISLLDLDDILGSYIDKRYFALYSFLCDNEGNELHIDINGKRPNQPYIYDLAFANDIKQNLVLQNHASSRFSRIDAEGRGIAGIRAEEIDASLKVDAPIIRILTRSNSEHTFSSKIIVGEVDDPSVTSVDIYRNNTRFATSTVTNGRFSQYISLNEGENVIRAECSFSGTLNSSNSIRITYVVDHSPNPVIEFSDNGNSVTITGEASTDPDNDIVSYRWVSDDKNNPVKLNINSSDKTLSIPKPEKSGEYNFSLTLTDMAGNSSTVRNYFILGSDKTITIPTAKSNPQWVKDAIVYEIFVRNFRPEGNLEKKKKKIDYLKDLGVNVLWLMPIMKNGSIITEMSAGYSIDDFYDIAPQFGTFDDYKTLLDSAHNNGIKVILDVTPNHVADQHPWVNDIRSYGQYSNYYNFVERRSLGDNRGMGQTLSSDGVYVRYSNWALANLNVGNGETRDYLIKMFNWWLNEKDTDGFRFDVYWGPENRYGKEYFWRPVREALKKVKSDIFLIGETDGTGTGSENNYADQGGASDAAYDWILYNTLKNIFSNRNVNTLHDQIINNNYYPGDNSYFFRFLENHDEERCATYYNNNQNKVAAALLLTIPGIPMIYMGQEVGWKGQRNVINFTGSDAEELYPVYKRLINARKKYPALRSRTLNRIPYSDGEIYCFSRKYLDQNFIVVSNLSSSNKNITLAIDEQRDLELSSPLTDNVTYYLNDFLNDTYYEVKKSDLTSFSISLPSHSAGVMLLSEKIEDLVVSVELPKGEDIPFEYSLSQNYPNPFNPTTVINYSISQPSEVKIVVYDILGREIKTLVNEFKQTGNYKVNFDASSISSGIYFYQLKADKFIETKKMVLVK